MKKIIALVDYKSHFGSKHSSRYYRSGMDMELLKDSFKKYSINLITKDFSSVDLRDGSWKGQAVVYTSQEDPGYHYKDFIEDVVYGLELAGAVVIPSYKFLRADNNKVFMEILRDLADTPEFQTITSKRYGTWDEFNQNIPDSLPLIIKTPQGAKSRGVFKTDSAVTAERLVKRISRLPISKGEVKDRLRPLRHKGYRIDSPYRKKFVVQNFIPGLQNDWKILVFGDKFFIEYRGVRDNDFRASGSQKFMFDNDIKDKIPEGIFAFAEKVRNTFGMPHWSMDIGYLDGCFHLFEFQALYFSSYAQERSRTYFVKEDDRFIRKNGEFTLEHLYAESTAKWLAARQSGTQE